MQFLKPTFGKVVVTIILSLLLVGQGLPLCIDPVEEGLRHIPYAADFLGCHYGYHRTFNGIPDLPFSFLYVIFVEVLIIVFSYLSVSLLAVVLKKIKDFVKS